MVAALFATVLALHFTNVRLDQYQGRERPAGHLGPLPDGRALRVLSLGFERLVADLFWLRACYYIGDEDVQAAGYPDAERLGELVTDIDPHFRSAYVLMNSVLTVLKSSPDAAIALLDKGIRNNPQAWRLHFLQGFTLFYDKHDYARAAKHIQLAFQQGGPPYLQLLATRLYAKGGDPETAMAFIEARLLDTEDQRFRKKLIRRYETLWVTRDLGRIDSAIRAFRASRAAEPDDVAALVRAGLLETEPKDPKQRPYTIRAGAAVATGKYESLELHGVEDAT